GTTAAGRKGIEKMIATAQVAQCSLVCAQAIGDSIPRAEVQFLSLNRGSHKAHSAAAVGDSKSAPIRLSSEDSCTSGKRRLARTGVRQEYDLLRDNTMRNRRVQLANR